MDLADALDPVLAAYDVLVERGEAIDDEWQYIQDLADAWRDRLAEVAGDRGGQPVDATIAAALGALAEEAERIVDPHRAIDWLSTCPQVALAALGEPS